MKEGKASEAKFGNKGLVILLCVLLVIIVGLSIGIVIGNFNRNDVVDLVEREWSDNITCLRDGTPYDVGVCIEEICDSNGENSENNRDSLVIGLYNKAIDNALIFKEYSKARELLISRSNYFVMSDNCDMAIGLLDDEEGDRLDDLNKGVFYSYALDLSMGCNNEEGVELWGGRLAEYNKGVDSGLGF